MPSSLSPTCKKGIAWMSVCGAPPCSTGQEYQPLPTVGRGRFSVDVPRSMWTSATAMRLCASSWLSLLASCPLNSMLSQELQLIPRVSVMAQPLWESKRVHTDLVVIKDDLQGKNIRLLACLLVSGVQRSGWLELHLGRWLS